MVTAEGPHKFKHNSDSTQEKPLAPSDQIIQQILVFGWTLQLSFQYSIQDLTGWT